MWGLTEFDEESYKRGMMQLGYEEGRAKGIAEGEARGEARGKAEGKAEGLFQSLRTLIKKMPLADAMALLEIPVADQAHYAAMLEQKN